MALEKSTFVPVDTDAEAAIISTLLTNPSSFLDITADLLPEDFGAPIYREIYQAIINCDTQGQPFDQITVANELQKRKKLSFIGGKATLETLVAQGKKNNQSTAYVSIIREKALLRGLLEAAQAINKSTLDPAADPDGVLSEAEALVFALGQERRKPSIVEMGQVVAELLQSLAQGHSQVLNGHSTGIAELDKMTGGLQPGQLIVIGARPGMGKSVLGTQLARHIAQTSNLVVPIFSYEMTRREIGIRLLSSSLGLNSKDLERGNFPESAQLSLSKAAQNLSQVPILIDDHPPETFTGLRSQARRIARRGPLGALVIDYIQLMHSDRRYKDENRTQEIAEITRGLKLLANELNVPVIAISQLSRNLESRVNKRPGLSDLRESGSIEQDANMVLFLYRDAQYSPNADAHSAELIIAKHRSGPTGTIDLIFEGDKGPRFREYPPGKGPRKKPTHKTAQEDDFQPF
jgi:replicative DNA helicase